ncbi:TspO/MBR family protein [Marinimicrobium alkaliphilum]|uniref:TspO/MBR family protein n=1 Tax=Marinimicrobium alkaliphilum TaxID=2202654 RepID=UPI000DB9CE18|nr:TspO/MBR family protein [Marinimicrobium alkaliphilum]
MSPVARAWAGFFGWLALVFFAAAVGGGASVDAGSFYLDLNRPGWAPPPWLFGPVWTLLYIMMAFAAWMVWREKGFSGAPLALGLFVLQLGFNALWTWLFFVWQWGFGAFIEILLLWLLLVATTSAFARIKPVAGLLLLPYLAWVSFACALTWAIWQRNPGVLG